jgi:hypothetical protein
MFLCNGLKFFLYNLVFKVFELAFIVLMLGFGV